MESLKKQGSYLYRVHDAVQEFCMYIFRKIDDLHCEMICTFEKFNFDLLSCFRSIPYKYVVVDSPKVLDKDDCFEFLHAHSKYLGDVDRCLELSQEKFQHIQQMRE